MSRPLKHTPAVPTLPRMSPSPVLDRTVLSAVQQRVARTLLYFDIFKHPLRVDEVRRFLDEDEPNEADVADALQDMASAGIIENHGDHFGFGDVAANTVVRLADNRRAEERMITARRMSRRIAAFPFTRAVMLSGSISKGRCAPDADIDFFVITAPGRLWLARTLLVAYKKIVLLNSHRDFCLNYFIDTDHLAIEDRNRFTATEVMTLVPTANGTLCDAFFAANTWAQRALPNHPVPDTRHTYDRTPRLKRWLERLLNTGLGDEIDEWCMLRTLRHWKSKFATMDHADFNNALRTRKYVSKHHPQHFQQRVLRAFDEKAQAFAEAHHKATVASLA